VHKRIVLRSAAMVAATLLITSLTTGVARAAPPYEGQSAMERAQIASEMRFAGASDAEIAKRTGLERKGTKATRTTRVSAGRTPGGAAALASDNRAVTVESSFYYDTVNKRYNAYVDYGWNDYATLGDGTWWGGNVGGNDALAISFSKSVVQRETPTQWSYWGQLRKTSSSVPDPAAPPGGMSESPNVWSNGPASAGFQWQDKVWSGYCGGAEVPTCAKYNSGHGTLWYNFTKPSGCLQIFGAYGHTWSSTTVTGLTLTLNGPELQFSSSSDRWQAASGAARIDC
jgi:hypothetical protein